MDGRAIGLLIGAALLGGVPFVSPVSAQGACVIRDSPCYPWRIDEGSSETVLLEVIPNNSITQATYRVCLCPPTTSVTLMFDFKERMVTLGTVPGATSGPICRDFKIQTARSSRVLLRREGTAGPVEGCYSTY